MANFLPNDDKTRVVDKLRRIYSAAPLHDLVNDAINRLERNLRSGGDRRIVVVIGDPGAGKSRTIQEVLNHHATFATAHRAFECPSPCSVGAMGASLLTHLGHAVVRENFRDNSLVARIEGVLPHSGINLVHIDEAQHALNSESVLKLTATRDCWKRITQVPYPFGLVLSGTPRVAEVILQDRQLSRRSIFVQARRMTDADNDDVEGLIAHYATEAGLGCEVTHDLSARVMHASGYAFGEVCKLVIVAIEDALMTGCGVLSIGNFASAYSADMDCDDQVNPFLLPAWNRLPAGALNMPATPIDLVPNTKRRA